jgi:hypothetical protein
MIRKISIDVAGFLENYLPIKKRTPIRLAFLKTLMSALGDVWNTYVVWRNETIIKANTTGETISLEWYLNYIVGASIGDIYIETAGVSGVSVGLQTAEPLIYVDAGIQSSEPTEYYAVGLLGEGSVFGTKTFAVYVPSAFMPFVEKIKAAVNSYKAAGKSFLIIEY